MLKCSALYFALLASASISGLAVPVASAQARTITVPAMPLNTALEEIAKQAGSKIEYDPDAVRGKTSLPTGNALDARSAVAAAIKDSGLAMFVNASGTITVSNDIVVTATRDEAETSFRVDGAQSSNRSGKSLKDLPQGTQVLTSALIRQQQALTLNDALRNSSGVAIERSNQGTPSFRVRGQESTALQNGLSANANTGSIDTIERIEVLKGPAAILSGARNLGGTVNIVDKRPSADPILDLTAQYGTFDDKKIVVDASNALTDDKLISARIIGVLARSERGFGGYVGRREQVIAPSLRFKNASSDYVMGLNASSSFDPLPNYRIVDPVDLTKFVTPASRIGPRDQGFRNDVTRFYASGEQRVTSWLSVVARGTYQRNNLDGRLISPAAFIDPENPNTLLAFSSSIRNEQRNTALDSYARIDFRTGPLKHTVSLGYNYSRLKYAQFNRPFDFDSTLILDISQDNSNLARPERSNELAFTLDQRQTGYYVQDFIDIGRLHLLAGIRRDVVKSRGQNIAFGDDPTNDRVTANSPNFGAVLDVTKAISIYGNFARGFVPATNGLTCDGERLPNSKTENIEGGLKGDFFRGRLSATASAYQLKEGNRSVVDQVCPAFDRYLTRGGLRTRGIELDVNGQILPGLDLSASYAFAAYKLADIPVEEGNVANGLYRHKYSVYLAYEVQNGGAKGLGIAAGIFGNGRSPVDTFGLIELPAQAQFDGNVTYRYGKARFNLGVRNITDRKLNGASTSPNYVARLQPRTVTASLTYSFFK